MQIMKGIQAYTEPRPALVFITSAGVERNAIIGDDEAARKKDIPIVQLNPGGTLNHKYAGEWAVRSSELPYTVIRSTGAGSGSGASFSTIAIDRCLNTRHGLPVSCLPACMHDAALACRPHNRG